MHVTKKIPVAVVSLWRAHGLTYARPCAQLWMMSRRKVQRVLALASDLSDEERAELAGELLSGLPYPGEEVTRSEWTKAWSEEIDRRLKSMAAGEKAVSWARARASIRASLRRKRAR